MAPTTCAIIATDEHLHVDPVLAAVERRLSLLIEKPLATELAEAHRGEADALDLRRDPFHHRVTPRDSRP